MNVLTGTTLTIKKVLPADSENPYEVGKLRISIAYPKVNENASKTVVWYDASELSGAITIQQPQPTVPATYDDNNVLLTEAVPGIDGWIKYTSPTLSLQGRHVITLYSGILNSNYSKVGRSSFNVGPSTKTVKVVSVSTSTTSKAITTVTETTI